MIWAVRWLIWRGKPKRKVGSEHDTADLLARMQKIPGARQAIRDEIGKTVQELHHRP